MSYVDAIHNKQKDVIELVERVKGKRVFKTLPVEHVFYYTDPNGTHRSIFGDRLKKFSSNNGKLAGREMALVQSKAKLFESDVNPIFRCLENNYLDADAPELNISFFDIEVAFETYAYPEDKVLKVRSKDKEEFEMMVIEVGSSDQKDSLEVFDEYESKWVAARKCRYIQPGRGFAPITDPFNRITAISVYQSWSKELITLVMAPTGMSEEEAKRITSKFTNCFLYWDEAEMLESFFLTIEDADVVSGWNSTGFDIPYMVNRVEEVCGSDTNRNWCLWGQKPRRREYIKFKKKSITYDLVGRVHLDYLELYQKHNPQQMHSYRLDFIGEVEVGENKVPYEGTLDQLYNRDFEKFVEYNRQDVMLLKKIDDRKKFIELANQIAHTNTVLLKTTMGSVALIEQSITNFAHSLGMVIPDRKGHVNDLDTEDDEEIVDDEYAEEEPAQKAGAVGAYVAKPKTGIHDEIGCCDINSLYPSTLRALNMSPETLVGHIRPHLTNKMIEDRIRSGVDKSDLWEGVFCTIEYEMIRDKRDDVELTVDFEDGTEMTLTAKEWYSYIFENEVGLAISANGTIFTTDQQGIIPGLLAQWYSQRKQMQAREKIWDSLAGKGISLEGLEL